MEQALREAEPAAPRIGISVRTSSWVGYCGYFADLDDWILEDGGIRLLRRA